MAFGGAPAGARAVGEGPAGALPKKSPLAGWSGAGFGAEGGAGGTPAGGVDAGLGFTSAQLGAPKRSSLSAAIVVLVSSLSAHRAARSNASNQKLRYFTGPYEIESWIVARGVCVL